MHITDLSGPFNRMFQFNDVHTPALYCNYKVHGTSKKNISGCGVPNAPLSSNRIIGGLDTPNSKYPWQVKL